MSRLKFDKHFFYFDFAFRSSSTADRSSISIKNLHCFGDLSVSTVSSIFFQNKFSSIIEHHRNQSIDCVQLCSINRTSSKDDCVLCLNSLFYNAKIGDDSFLLKNGLRFISDAQNPRYLLQTVTYRWNQSRTFNDFYVWKHFLNILEENFLSKFYRETFSRMFVWWSSELFSTFAIMEQLERDKYLLTALKFLLIAVVLFLFAGVLGVFVSLTICLNFLTTMAVLTLLQFQISVENTVFFTIALIVSCQYSILYAMR